MLEKVPSHVYPFDFLIVYTAKTQYRKFEAKLFPEKELHGVSPNYHLHISESALYIPRIGPHIFLQQHRQKSWEYINSSQRHECGN
jgi:hypothetical protein